MVSGKFLIFLLIPSILFASYETQTWSQTDIEQKVIYNSNCVAFRLDDIQDYFTREAQMDLITIFLLDFWLRLKRKLAFKRELSTARYSGM